MASTATGSTTAIAIVVELPLLSRDLKAGAAVLVGSLDAVDVADEKEDVLVVILGAVKSRGIWATTVAAGAMRNIFAAVLQHSNDPIPIPPGSQQLITRLVTCSRALFAVYRPCCR